MLLLLVVHEWVPSATAHLVTVDAYVVRLQGLAVRRSVLSPGASASTDVLDLVTGEPLVEVGETPE